MASKKLQALLVGINNYLRPIIPTLNGTHKDVAAMQIYLETTYGEEYELDLLVLKDEEATRGNIIKGFEQHLAKAGAGDIALFYFSGHGSWGKTNEAFLQFDPDEKEEALVCYDSRTKGKYDLADKELAVLINYVAKNNAELVLLVDACHSGSLTRAINTRLVLEESRARKIEHYLYDTTVDENKFYYYKQQLKEKAVTHIPSSRHLLMSACGELELAREDENGGWFTQALLKTLKNQTSELSYFQVYNQLYADISQLPAKQSPQLEAYGSFNANHVFLTGAKLNRPQKRFKVTKNGDKIDYSISFGAQSGFPLDLQQKVHFNLYETKDSKAIAGQGEVSSIGFKDSKIHLSLPTMKYATNYWAELLDFTVTPMRLCFKGDSSDFNRLSEGLASRALNQIILVENEAISPFVLAWQEDKKCYHLSETNRPVFIYEIEKEALQNDALLEQLFDTFEHLCQWHKTIELDSPKARIDKTDIRVTFHALNARDSKVATCAIQDKQAEQIKDLEDANKTPQDDYHKVILKYQEGQLIDYQVSLMNQSFTDSYYIACVIISSSYGVIPLRSNILLEPRQSIKKIIDPQYGALMIDKDKDLDISNYLKIFISRKEITTIQGLQLPGLRLEEKLKGKLSKKDIEIRKNMNEWCAKKLIINLKR